jgi:hypothetical protein
MVVGPSVPRNLTYRKRKTMKMKIQRDAELKPFISDSTAVLGGVPMGGRGPLARRANTRVTPWDSVLQHEADRAAMLTGV